MSKKIIKTLKINLKIKSYEDFKSHGLLKPMKGSIK